ncbi:hypothetical protein [Pseudoalteromonas luteoviolacea]|nr:hypothetical protein [Pseudoalteromonas luteoviolacea]
MSTRGEKIPNLTVKQVNMLAKGKPSKTPMETVCIRRPEAWRP